MHVDLDVAVLILLYKGPGENDQGRKKCHGHCNCLLLFKTFSELWNSYQRRQVRDQAEKAVHGRNGLLDL